MANSNALTRRGFIEKSAFSAGAFGMGMAGSELQPAFKSSKDKLPREFNVVSINYHTFRKEVDTIEERIKNTLEQMERVLIYEPDIICLTETVQQAFVNKLPKVRDMAEPVPGPISSQFAKFARDNNCYVICPLHTQQPDGHVYNSAILFGRKGEVVGQYHKIHPTESEIKKGTDCGAPPPPVFKTDFGTIGILICFDANWPDLFQSLKQAGAEVVFWPSAYPGGRVLNAWAMMNHFYLVSCPWSESCLVIDINGDVLASSDYWRTYVYYTINLDKQLFHIDYQQGKVAKIEKKYKRKIDIQYTTYESWFSIESRSPDVTVSQIMEEFELVTLDQYIQRCTDVHEKELKKYRGY